MLVKIFYRISKSAKKIFELKTLLKVTDEHICYFPQQKIKRIDAWFQVLKRFVFSLSPLTKHFGM